ncbi:hypothetical protein PFFCH_03385 [Plasmodium falciparum FCH/4]|uniref:Uncharacterized protein n=1 Tax=Plasmodium falciparum FCH/4 TaxID=1036724 RepID=A0A024VLL7_PLAFA|nr:hypothetical protein PFFCH_03385 [Plasmodium falciparum FCH/4]
MWVGEETRRRRSFCDKQTHNYPYDGKYKKYENYGNLESLPNDEYRNILNVQHLNSNYNKWEQEKDILYEESESSQLYIYIFIYMNYRNNF